MDIPKLNLSAASGQIPWKPIGIALLILLAVALLYLTTWRANRRLKRELLRLAGAEQAPPTENSAVPETTEPLLASDTTPMDSSPVPAGYPMPILRSGLKFNLQPEFGLPYPAFNAWNTAGTLRVLAVLDTTGSFVTSRESADSEPLFRLGYYNSSVPAAPCCRKPKSPLSASSRTASAWWLKSAPCSKPVWRSPLILKTPKPMTPSYETSSVEAWLRENPIRLTVAAGRVAKKRSG